MVGLSFIMAAELVACFRFGERTMRWKFRKNSEDVWEYTTDRNVAENLSSEGYSVIWWPFIPGESA